MVGLTIPQNDKIQSLFDKNVTMLIIIFDVFLKPIVSYWQMPASSLPMFEA